MDQGRVLVIASRATREVDGVIDRLRDSGLEVVRFSPCRYPGFANCSWDPETGASGFGALGAAWLCDFAGWSVEADLTGLEREVAIAEVTAFVDGMLLALDTNWLNHPQSVRSASRKLLQLKVARQLGIGTPPTCVTNDPQMARQFCTEHGAVASKALATGFVRYGDETLKLYTRKVDASSDAIFDSLVNGPLIFQRLILKSEEVRTIVVDDAVFAVRADLRGLPIDHVDMRRFDYGAMRDRFSACRDRSDLCDHSRIIVRALGLSYGCIDWAIETDGTAYFLECNPLGSFKWFEICGGQDITGHIAEALVTRCAR